MRARGDKLRTLRRRRRGTLALEDRSLTSNTRKRYFEAVRKITPMLEHAQDDWDTILTEWIESQYSAGEGITCINDTLCGLQHFAPFCKGQLTKSWRLFRVWRRLEKPKQAPPLPLVVFLGILGRSIEQEFLSMAVLLVLGFWGMLRTGELLKVELRHILCANHTVVIQLGQTKTGLRRAVDENVVLYDEVPKLIITTFLQTQIGSDRRSKVWNGTPQDFRKHFRELHHFFRVDKLFRPYSLRRGGATEDFRQHGLMERSLLRGRWGTSTAARQYIQEGLSALTTIKIPPTYWQLLNRYAVFYFHDLLFGRSVPGDVEMPKGGTWVKK